MCQGYRSAGWLKRQESGLLERELSVHLGAANNAKKKGEDEAAIKNNDESVDKPEGEIKVMNIKVVVNSYS